MTHALAILLLLAQAEGVEVALEGASSPIESVLPVDTPPAPREPGRWHALARLEASTLMLLPRGGAGGEEGWAQLTPTVVVDDGEEWGLHVGAPVRVRLWGANAGVRRVRRENWDSLSDWGQLVRTLKLGGKAGPCTPREPTCHPPTSKPSTR
ncbi:hypothetical protein [Hyalangium versicolor]|uniref:hypothetical protein n=1 Tax=Hyalangium versicolor TaxID=2861190 RepID=UPI001CCB924B|nr:hypothetical protein [Hyalangium versicolor]